jgi:N-acetylmuramoyl-L-alanine amidase
MFLFARRFISFVMWGVLMLFAVPHVMAAPTITSLRSGDKNEATRVVLDVKGAKEFDAFTLLAPPRLVVDVVDASWSVPVAAIRSTLGSRVIKEIRHGSPEPGIHRVVIDLSRPVEITKQFIIPPSTRYKTHRVVIDFSYIDSAEARAEIVRMAKVVPQFAHRETLKAEPEEEEELKFAPRKIRPSRDHLAKVPQTSAAAQRVTGAPTPTPKPAKNFRMPVVVVDAGHGGIDPGALGRSGTREKKITFAFAVALKDALERTGKYKAILTRKGDYYVNLRERVKIAHKQKGDIFISLHADSHPRSKTRGLSVYTLSEKASDREADSLAKKANQGDVISGVDLTSASSDVQQVLIDMVQRDTKNASAYFAEVLVRELGKEAKLLKNTHRFAGFAVLTAADIPSVLVELGYLSNSTEERLLRTESYKKKLVSAMVTAINQYFSGSE